MGYDVVALGELLIDFIIGVIRLLRPIPGGAAQCAVYVGRFGHKTAMI
jgi:sugar/nucleoside kinase (ribokinase family)